MIQASKSDFVMYERAPMRCDVKLSGPQRVVNVRELQRGLEGFRARSRAEYASVARGARSRTILRGVFIHELMRLAVIFSQPVIY